MATESLRGNSTNRPHGKIDFYLGRRPSTVDGRQHSRAAHSSTPRRPNGGVGPDRRRSPDPSVDPPMVTFP